MKNRIMATLLAFCMVLVLLPGTALAADTGTCGKKATWTLSNGTLTVSGSGDMEHYAPGKAPWYSKRSEIKKIVVNGVSSIGRHAFRDCVNVTSVNISGTVTVIDQNAFNGCVSLTDLTIPGSVTKIGCHAFDSCSSLRNLTIKNGVNTIEWSAFQNCNSLTFVTLPMGVKSIDSNVFSGCTSLKTVNIPSSVNSIGSGAFSQCTSLETVTIASGATSIGEKAFYQCKKLKNINIPDSVNIIGYSAFQDCTSLTSMIIPESVSTFGRRAFMGCNNLTNVVIQGGITKMDGETFQDCSKLNSVVIGEGTTAISFGTFNNCNNLKSVTIPSSVNKIGPYSFEYCTALTDVYYAGTETQWNNIEIQSYSATASNKRLFLATKHYNSSGPQVSLSAPAVKLSSTSVTEGTSVTASWGAVSGAAKYHFDLWDDVTDRMQIATSEIFDSTKMTISNTLSPGRYRVEVYAVDANGNKGPAGSAILTVTQKSTSTAKTMTVTFNPNSGTVSPKTATVTNGQTYGTLPTPTRTGYKFDGWYTSKTGSTKVTSSTKVTKTVNHTLYAHWTKARTFIVNLDANGGDVATEFLAVSTSMRYRSLPTPSRSGYHFSGWYTAKTGGVKVTASTQVKSGVTTLYARWDRTNPTVKSRQTKNCQIVIPGDYKVLLYSNETTPTVAKTALSQSGEYTITCTKMASLSNGTVRYYGRFPKVSNTASYWFTYSNEMFINQ